jgi:hypothetical protein
MAKKSWDKLETDAHTFHFFCQAWYQILIINYAYAILNFVMFNVYKSMFFNIRNIARKQLVSQWVVDNMLISVSSSYEFNVSLREHGKWYLQPNGPALSCH